MEIGGALAQPGHRAYGERMAQDEEKPICKVCLGAGGEWIELNGTQAKHKKWVPCTTCDGTGRR
ncbi:hypothetical protein [Spongiactinospora rosea]|uniref:hypothetical protein n=1 Tax=Spongiactinospora rosea TaxID=2248750 RepID=UPI0011C076AC|nr:hypothetical protein [Spongiactinospora rosea]